MSILKIIIIALISVFLIYALISWAESNTAGLPLDETQYSTVDNAKAQIAIHSLNTTNEAIFDRLVSRILPGINNSLLLYFADIERFWVQNFVSNTINAENVYFSNNIDPLLFNNSSVIIGGAESFNGLCRNSWGAGNCSAVITCNEGLLQPTMIFSSTHTVYYCII